MGGEAGGWNCCDPLHHQTRVQADYEVRAAGPTSDPAAREPIPLILNDKAGKYHSTAGADELQKVADQLGVAARVMATQSTEEMRRLVCQLRDEGAKRIAVAGGDGTIHIAVQELAHSDVALGIVPQGTANNFATALRLPQDLSSALRVLEEGVVKAVDLGYIDGEYFTETAGVGLFADALALYGKSNKNFFRALAAALRLLFSFRASRIRLTVDGKTTTERAVMCVAANTFRLGVAFPVAPGAKVTDQELDIVILGDLKRSELIPYFRAIRRQLHLSLPKAQSIKGKTIRIESARPMPVHCDDHIIGTTPVTIEVKPGALKVLVERL